MTKKSQNIFLIFGIVVLVIMVLNLNFAEALRGLQHTGYWFLAVIALWAVLYMMNTLSWWLILKHLDKNDNDNDVTNDATYNFSFWWLYKITISGFALNYATPGGLMGGEPYRIMELSPYIGTEKASSSVILFALTHIFSHLWFWLLSAVLFVILFPLNIFTGLIMLAVVTFCIGGIWLFIAAYKNGMTVKVMQILDHIPFLKRWAHPFLEKHSEKLRQIDKQIASLHEKSKSTLVAVVSIELLCRICSALEIFFILLVIMPRMNFLHCILILAFTSLFANMLFFMPLQLGGREGGFLMSATSMGITASTSIFLALIVRLRELVWTGIGLLIIKFGSKKPKKHNPKDENIVKNE
ncbi:MAG: flippase-like domain-containing protein [Prevotella sp.]|nr:flippase-like domain-containing protein [Prevotella sp.]